MLDKIGQEIKPGSVIAYPYQYADIIGMRIGKVTKVEVKQVPYDKDGVDRITVKGINDDWADEPELLSRKSTLQFPKRVIVIDKLTLSPKLQALIDSIPNE